MANSRTYHYELKIGDIPEKEKPYFEFDENIRFFKCGIAAKGKETVELNNNEKKMKDAEKEQRLEDGFYNKIHFLIRKSNFIYFLLFKKIIIGVCDYCFYFGGSGQKKEKNKKTKKIKLEQYIPNNIELPEYLQTKEGIEKALKVFKKDKDIEKFMACVVNYIYAKQKGNAVENTLDCFNYYWSSVNTIFSLYHSKCVGKQYEILNGNKKGFPSGDANELYSLAKLIDDRFVGKITDAELDRVIEKLSAFVTNKWDGKYVTRELFEEKGRYESFAREIESLYDQPSGAYVHFITRVAYQYRNWFLHGNKAIPICKIQNDKYHPDIIRLINYLLDDFICTYLIRLTNYIEDDSNMPRIARTVAKEIIKKKKKDDSDGGDSAQTQPAAAQQNAAGE